MKGEISYYKILGVDENASNHELRKAFCKLSIELHPDTTSLEIDEAKSKFQEVLEAYENLNNSNLRKIYDDKLKEKLRSKNKNKVLNNFLKKPVNPSKKPINQNSLQSLELWLTDLGAVKDINNPSKWYLLLSNWNSTIIFEQEDLSVIWESEGEETKRLFSYCINREDVENAILQGP